MSPPKNNCYRYFIFTWFCPPHPQISNFTKWKHLSFKNDCRAVVEKGLFHSRKGMLPSSRLKSPLKMVPPSYTRSTQSDSQLVTHRWQTSKCRVVPYNLSLAVMFFSMFVTSSCSRNLKITSKGPVFVCPCRNITYTPLFKSQLLLKIKILLTAGELCDKLALFLPSLSLPIWQHNIFPLLYSATAFVFASLS